MLWYETILALTDFSHPALTEAKALLDLGDREGCARRVIEHFRRRYAPRYLFDADDLRRGDEPHHIRAHLSRRNRLAL